MDCPPRLGPVGGQGLEGGQLSIELRHDVRLGHAKSKIADVLNDTIFSARFLG